MIDVEQEIFKKTIFAFNKIGSIASAKALLFLFF